MIQPKFCAGIFFIFFIFYSLLYKNGINIKWYISLKRMNIQANNIIYMFFIVPDTIDEPL